MKKKVYRCPKTKVVYSYDLDTELMYGNTLSGGGSMMGLPIVGSNMKASALPKTESEEESLDWDWDNSDR